jgi:hypothetical protein
VLLVNRSRGCGRCFNDLVAISQKCLQQSPRNLTFCSGPSVWTRSAAGESEVAVSFVPDGQENHFRLIEKRQGQRVPREAIAGFEPAGPIGP